MKKNIISFVLLFLVGVPNTFAAKLAPEAITPQAMVDQTKLLKGAVLPDIIEGSAKAPVTIIEYYSLTCGHCAEFFLDTLPTIRKKYIETGKVRLIEREFPYDARATAAFMLARCAPKEQYHSFIQVFFSKFMSWVPVKDAMTPLKQIAKLGGFTDEKFKACLANADLMKKLNDSYKKGNKEFGVIATPTFFINGEKYVGSFTVAELSKIIDSLLNNTHN